MQGTRLKGLNKIEHSRTTWYVDVDDSLSWQKVIAGDGHTEVLHDSCNT